MPKHGTSETFAFHQLLSLVSQTGRIIKSDPILSFVTERCTDRIILNDGVPGITYFIVSKHAVFFCVFSTSRVAPLRFRSSESVILCVLQEESPSIGPHTESDFIGGESPLNPEVKRIW